MKPEDGAARAVPSGRAPDGFDASDALDACNVVWDSPSANALESMPCGGGDVGMNVWVENGDVLVYLSRSGTFDELNSFPKLGRIRLRLTPNPFDEPESFRQELRLREGNVEIRARKNGLETKISVWADVFHPTAYVDVEASSPISLSATYENWRFQERRLASGELQSCRTYMKAPFDAVMKPDVVRFDQDGVLFFHRNEGRTAFDVAVAQQKLDEIKAELWNPLRDLVFGGRMSGEGFIPGGTTEGRYASTDFKGWILKSSAPVKRCALQIAFHTEVVPTEQSWLDGLASLEEKIRGRRSEARTASLEWWRAFWERSYVFVDWENPDPRNEKWQVGRNYQVFRYQLGCNAYGAYPTKFNGGLFCVDPEFVEPELRFTPDFRRWGGGSFTAQNQRLVYWPMLRSGDFDMMKPQFDFYNNALGNAERRTRRYWGHDGASFVEQIENYGLPVAFEYGWNRPADLDPGMQNNRWLEYVWDTVFEFGMMILDRYDCNGDDPAPYLPLIESCLRFYDEHYRMLNKQRSGSELDERGKLLIQPGTACETYKRAVNPLPTLCALRCVTDRMLALPEELLSGSRRTYLEELRARIPEDFYYRVQCGRKTFSPAKSWEWMQNVDFAQMYSVFPWGIHGVGRPELDVARDTWRFGADDEHQHGVASWQQNAIFCARLGLKKEAAELTIEKMKDAPRRFPTWWGPGFDWVPDHNWGGSGMIGLQEMVMQCHDGKICLAAGLPKTWNVAFKLHAPRRTVVEGRIADGKIQSLRATPEERLKDVEFIED